MAIPVETIDKMNTLNDQNITIIVDLVDFLSNSQEARNAHDVELFRKIRSHTSQNPMTETEVEDFVSSVRSELYANRH